MNSSNIKVAGIVSTIQHILITFLLAMLTNMQLDSKITWKAACLGAAVVTLRDLNSLFRTAPSINSDPKKEEKKEGE